MNAGKLILLTLALTTLAMPVCADEPYESEEPEEDPCAAVQVTPWEPYVGVYPDCLPQKDEP